jgi:hypothetical protein
MKTYAIPRSVEADLRRKILEYFLYPGYAAVMPHTEPFKADITARVYTVAQMVYVRQGLRSAGLIERVRGTTRDMVYVITEQGRAFLKRDYTVSEE